MKKSTFILLCITVCGLTACSEQKINEWACGHKMGQMRCNNAIVDADKNKEYDKLKKYLEISANYGNPKMQAGLGLWYQHDKYGEKDYQKALYWLQKSAEQGNKDGQSALADTYMNGWGVKQDYAKAFDLYKKSAG